MWWTNILTLLCIMAQAAFDRNAADFGRLSTGGGLCISQVIHKVRTRLWYTIILASIF